MHARQVPVLEIGGTHVSAAWVDVGAWRVDTGTGVRRPVDARGTADELVAAMVGAGGSLRAADGESWGVAIPGPFDYVRGVADFHGVGKFEALRGVDLGAVLRRALSGGTGRIHFVNDAEAFAVGEWAAGAARGHHRVIGVTLGTGVGSAFLVDGRAQHRGPGVPSQGRLHLLEVAGRPLEESVSRRAVRARYADLTGDASSDPLDVHDIVARARDSDTDALKAIDEPLRALGRVLAPRVLDFEASLLVVGGSIALAWDVIEGPLHRGMSEAVPGWHESSRITAADRIGDAALLGAAWQAVRPAGPGTSRR